MNCPICKKQKKLVNHHISYKDNITVKICHSCNLKIGKNKKYAPKYQNIDERPRRPNEHLYTTIRLSEKTTKRIEKIGTLGDTYDTVINNALATLEKQRKINFFC